MEKVPSNRVHRRAVALLCLFASAGAAGVAELPDVKTIETGKELRRKQLEEDKKQRGNVGRDIRKFGEQVASKLDSIVQRKAFDLWGDPWTLQGIPLIYPSGPNGFHLGLRVAIQNIQREDPHKMQLEAQVLATDKGRYKHFIGLDLPFAFDGAFRIKVRAAYDRDITLKYFGIGNENAVDPVLIQQESVLYQSVRAWPSLNIQILKNFTRNIRAGPILGLKWTSVTVLPGSLLDRDMPLGVSGGRTHYLGLAFIYDTLDFEPYPTKGHTHEIYLAAYNKFTGSQYDFLRMTYTHRHYKPVHSKLVFAYRALFETLSGNVPFYELTAVGGADPSISFGGDRFIRGYEPNRFIDKIRFVLGMELRWDPLVVTFAGQKFKLGLVPFIDVGRVWPTFLPLRLGTWNVSTGWGARIIWNNRFIVRGDFAVTAERTSFYAELGHSF
jgi:hypothetical protein